MKTARPTTRPRSARWPRPAVTFLVVAGYVDQGGSGIIQAALDTGAFDTFVFPDGMVSQALVDNFGSDIDGSFGQNPGTDSEGANIYQSMAEEAGFDGTSPFSAEAMTRRR
jgi:branched-chain amino acid transport system substrate-binding protein